MVDGTEEAMVMVIHGERSLTDPKALVSRIVWNFSQFSRRILLLCRWDFARAGGREIDAYRLKGLVNRFSRWSSWPLPIPDLVVVDN